MQFGVTGWVALVIYSVVMIGVGFFVLRRFGSSISEFLLAQRKARWWVGAFSIAATWIWAPALFVSAQKAYTQGVVGWGWFFVPNVLCLIVFGLLAVKLRRRFEGTTLPEYMQHSYGRGVHGLYTTQFVILQVCSFAVQLLAGGTILSMFTGIPFAPLVIIIAAIAVTYSVMGGFRASLITDFIQMTFMIVVGVIGATVVLRAGGWLAVGQGFGGIGGNFDQFFSTKGIEAMLTFGLVGALGLFAGPFGDQTFWQRVFAMDKRHTIRAFTLGAGLFAIIPIAFGVIGFAGAGLGIEVEDPQVTNLVVMSKFIGPGLMAVVLVMILSGLSSTMDSNLSAISSLTVIDLLPGSRKPLLSGRWSMAVLAVAGIGIALIPGLRILHLWLFYGTLRATTLLPTVLTLWRGPATRGRWVFYGLLGSLVIGVPFYAVAAIMGSWQGQLIGAGLAVGISGICTALGQRHAS